MIVVSQDLEVYNVDDEKMCVTAKPAHTDEKPFHYTQGAAAAGQNLRPILFGGHALALAAVVVDCTRSYMIIQRECIEDD